MRNTCIYKVAGPLTFRLSSVSLFPKVVEIAGKRKMKGWGGNLQNVEKSLRKIYIPDDGYVFVQVDQSGAEALIVAYCGVAGQYRQLFINGIKPHTYLAMSLFKHIWPGKMLENGLISSSENFDIEAIIRTPIALLKQHPDFKNLAALIKDSDDWSLSERYYYLAKQTEHSSNYDIQPPTFRMNVLEKSGGKIVISKEDSEKFLATKHGLFPEIKGSFHRYVERCARNDRILYNLHGHPYQIASPDFDERDLKELYAWIPQSTVGEITNIAYARMYKFIASENRDWSLLANTHDSYLIQCPENDVDECVKVAQEFMNQKFKSPIDGVEFSMRSEAAVGYNWAPYKKGSNEKGLKGL